MKNNPYLNWVEPEKENIAKAKEILDQLVGEAVRITMKTNELVNGWITYPIYMGFNSMFFGDIIKGEIMFNSGTGTLGKDNQVLISVKKIEVFDGEWKTCFSS